MHYSSLQQAVIDLEKHGHLVVIRDEVDPYLEMAAIHLRIHEAGGPALLFENIKGSKFKAVSNLFGTIDRSRFLFRETMKDVERLIALKSNPLLALKNPLELLRVVPGALHALPMQTKRAAATYSETSIDQLPLITHWPNDGGAFVTLPQVYTEDPEKPGVMASNLGMYRIQLNGNDYITNQEVGLHYQLHRGIGVHQTKYEKKGLPMKVSIFIGGPPAHTFAAVMPLPEGLSELNFAGTLAGRRFRYHYDSAGNFISNDADFVITGEVWPGAVKPEGPFGDHLGYYSLRHLFPLMKIKKVYHRKDAIWAFTVVGRPPQEDTAFGNLIHEMTGSILPTLIPGLLDIHAVDAAGVHPLLLALGSERYTPYIKEQKPQEILTIANHVLGMGQMSLAKYLFITANDKYSSVNTHDIPAFFVHVLARIDWQRDVHFHTQTSIDTLDYSGTGLNSGSKVVFAAAGNPVRELAKNIPYDFSGNSDFTQIGMPLPGVVSMSGKSFSGYDNAKTEIAHLSDFLSKKNTAEIALIVLCDDAGFTAASINNFVWVTFTRSNPSHDIYGVDEFTEFKHWGCRGPLIIDARKKPFHAPELIKDLMVEQHIDRFFKKGAILSKWG